MTVGERIKQKREEKGVSQVELADAINTTKQNIYKYENNIISNIPSDKIEAIAKYLSVSPADLMGWNDEKAFNQDPRDERIRVLARHLDEVPDEDRESLIDTIESTIDMYLRAKGLK